MSPPRVADNTLLQKRCVEMLTARIGMEVLSKQFRGGSRFLFLAPTMVPSATSWQAKNLRSQVESLE